MLSLIIWCCGIFLEALLLFRGLRAKLFLRYPNFYIYVLSLFLSDGLLYLAYLAKLASYDKWSWYAGFLNLFLGCGILLEIFRHVLSRYAGVEKFARIVSFGIMGAVLCFAVIYPMFAPDGSAAHALFVRLQRDFLMVQAILLFGLAPACLLLRHIDGEESERDDSRVWANSRSDANCSSSKGLHWASVSVGVDASAAAYLFGRSSHLAGNSLVLLRESGT